MMAVLNNFIRRILGPMSFPRFPKPLPTLVDQLYQPPPTVKVTSVPVTTNPPPA
jgi:hypothetical protein